MLGPAIPGSQATEVYVSYISKDNPHENLDWLSVASAKNIFVGQLSLERGRGVGVGRI
jgi:hypothetical protein